MQKNVNSSDVEELRNVPTVNPAISVILATKGSKTDLLERCIRSLLKQNFKDFEIILVYGVYPRINKKSY